MSVIDGLLDKDLPKDNKADLLDVTDEAKPYHLLPSFFILSPVTSEKSDISK